MVKKDKILSVGELHVIVGDTDFVERMEGIPICLQYCE